MKDAAPNAEVWMCYIRLPGFWRYTLYSETVDVSKLAKEHIYDGRPGGGHKNAAGFQSKSIAWLEGDIVNCPIKSEHSGYI
jgi:nanoRNase/pAp phosphatase (c-di-AMP/oligoRNAs hydrolase)